MASPPQLCRLLFLALAAWPARATDDATAFVQQGMAHGQQERASLHLGQQPVVAASAAGEEPQEVYEVVPVMEEGLPYVAAQRKNPEPDQVVPVEDDNDYEQDSFVVKNTTPPPPLMANQ
mmetsp:Transcript_22592/g.70353  ORF Transcript_22592/g.70353 Transcript_22592/m.70353 type:complete len:120 (-) Transcript_22592:152-511(-)